MSDDYDVVIDENGAVHRVARVAAPKATCYRCHRTNDAQMFSIKDKNREVTNLCGTCVGDMILSYDKLVSRVDRLERIAHAASVPPSGFKM